MKKSLVFIILLLISVPALSYVGPFRERSSVIHKWLNDNGYGGSVNDGLMQYFSSVSTLSEGTLFDHVNNVMDQHGYSGSLHDKLTAFFQDETGKDGRGDAERAFWRDSGNNFDIASGTDALLLESGDYLLLESGDKLLLE